MEPAFAKPPTGLLIASHRVLPHRPILGVSAPIQSYNWYHWYQQGDGPSTGGGGPSPTPRNAYGGPRLSKPALIASSLASNFV